MAVLDTGVDVGAEGLRSTPDGRVKVVDSQDCSGGGDVRMGAWVDVVGDNREVLSPFTGRAFCLPKTWTFAEGKEGKVRMGCKRAYELFPGALVERMKAEAKEKWMLKHNEAEAEAARALALALESGGGGGDNRNSLLVKELQERVDVLKTARTGYVDHGPVLDVFTWLDEEGVDRVVVHSTDDVHGTSLDHHIPMASYRVEHQFELFSESSQLNFCVNVYDAGELVSIVVDSGPHGTHVAGIVAGYFPDQPELNGVAPGAQIISLKIGDTRLDSMETGTAIARAMSAAAAAGADIINMSFGEPTHMPGGGRIVDLCRQLVLKHNIVFVASAGNTGPALSTVGAPGGSTSHLIGVSAWVDPEMMLAEYEMRPGETPPATAYTWTARGPTYEGALGVCVAAPGGAIACVPRWTLNSKQLMNGTSMSSPNTAGGIALLLSGLKHLNKPRSPARIRRALTHTALRLDNVETHAQGHGLIQLAKAFESCCYAPPPVLAAKKKSVLDIAFDVVFPSRPASTVTGFSHGLYLREPWETKAQAEHVVEIRPLFDVDSDSPSVGFFVDPVAKTTKADHVDMEVQVRLEVTNPLFVRAPSHILLHGKAHAFKIAVDPTVLAPGTVNFCEVLGFDADLDPKDVGPLFRVPITVVMPDCTPISPAGMVVFPRLTFQPGTIHRKFLVPPPGATWCEVTLRNESFSHPDGRLVALHCLQLRPQSRFREDELEVVQRLESEPQATIVKSLAVVPGCTLEVCVAQYWSSSLGSGEISVEVRFFGLVVSPTVVSLSPGNGWMAPITMRADLANFKVEPSGELSTWLSVVAPTEKSVKPAGKGGHSARNSVLAAFPPDSRATWELRLVHEFKVDKGQGFKVKFPLALNSLLYDSPLESQMSMVFDQDKRLLAVFDYGVASKPSSMVEKHGGGNITVISVIRHESVAVLDRLKDLALLVERGLSSPLPVLAFAQTSGPLVGPAAAFKSRVLRRGQELGLSFAPQAVPSSEDFFKKLPSGIAPGDVLSGSVWFATGVGRKKDDAVFALPMVCVVPPRPVPAASSSSSSSATGSGTPPLSERVKLVVVPTIKAKLKLLESLVGASDASLFESEYAACDALLGAVVPADPAPYATATVHPEQADLRAELLSIALRRAVAQQRKRGDELEDGGVEMDDTAVQAFARACLDVVTQSRALEAALQGLDLLRRRRVDLEGGSPDPDAVRMQAGTKRLGEALFARIHAYLDVLGTPGCIEVAGLGGGMEVDADLNQALDLATAVLPSTKDAKFTQVRVRMAKKGERWATALSLLDSLRGEDAATLKGLPEPTSPRQLLEERIRLLERLGWEHCAESARREVGVSFPGEWPVF